MAMRWIVRLTKEPKVRIFKKNYFPRGFHYKKDAKEQKREVEKHEGEAVVEHFDKTNPQHRTGCERSYQGLINDSEKLDCQNL